MSNSIIGENLVVEGDITSKEGRVEVRGRVVGDIVAKAVDVMDGGQVDGMLSADKVTIQGKQSGTIKCGALSLESSSEVTSDVTAQTLSSETGAKLVGSVQITGA